LYQEGNLEDALSPLRKAREIYEDQGNNAKAAELTELINQIKQRLETQKK